MKEGTPSAIRSSSRMEERAMNPEIECYARQDIAERLWVEIERRAEMEGGDLPANVTYLTAMIDRDPEPPSPAAPANLPFDRTAHCRRIASYGGQACLARHGVAHYRAIGKAGARV